MMKISECVRTAQAEAAFRSGAQASAAAYKDAAPASARLPMRSPRGGSSSPRSAPPALALRIGATLALAATASAQGNVVDEVTGILETCTAAAIDVNTRCCPGAGGCLIGVPATCPDKLCADTYMPFYQQCGTVLQALDAQLGNAGFASLYESCVAIKGDRDATGAVVDDSVAVSPVFAFTTPTPNVGRGWRVTVDGVMGGRSHGTWATGDGATCNGALLGGTIELTHGGFVTIRSPSLTAHQLAGADGLRICSKSTTDYGVHDGSGDLYKLKLNDNSRSDWQADFNTLEAGTSSNEEGCEGGTISTVPFSQFWPSHWGRITGAQGSIDASAITNIGLDVSFQTEDGGSNDELDHDACAHGHADCQNLNPFGLCVMWIESYTNADAAQAPANAH